MWVPAVGPEEEQPVEQRLDVDHIGFPLWKDPEDAAVVLERKADQCFTNMLNFELNISSLNNFCALLSHCYFTSVATTS